VRFRAVHKLMSYLLAASAVTTLCSSGAVPLPTLALLVLVAVCSWFVEPGTRMGQLLERASLVLSVVALAFFGLSLYQVIQSFPEPDLTPVLNLVLFLLGYKLFLRRNNRDYLQIYILSFVLVLAGAWLAQSVAFVVAFVVYVILATWTLTLFHLRREIEDNYLVKHLPESGSEKVTAARVLNSRRVVGRSFFLSTGLVAVAVFVGAALVFTLIPRVGLGFLSGGFRPRMNIVGFSDEVMLGHHGVISGDNQTVVLWVKVPRIAAMDDHDRQRTIPQLYWRGTVYDTYLAGQWLRSHRKETETLLDELPALDGGKLWWLRSQEGPPNQSHARPQTALAQYDEQEIQVVGLAHPVAFALDEPIAFRVPPPAEGSFIGVGVYPRYSGEVALRLMRLLTRAQTPLKDFAGASYIAYSRNPMFGRAPVGRGRTLAELTAEGQLQSYLDVPPSLTARVKELALSITAGKPTPMAKAVAVVEWLRKTHGYTTDLKRDTSIADPLEDFLFKQTAGHCEYFASAAAILLRLAGVPTRYVNGFLGGEWNEIGKFLVIRDGRAHSWIEIYLGSAGWMRLDATPSAGPSSRIGKLRQLFDSVEFYWSRWVIDYDASRQIELARRLGGGVGSGHAGFSAIDWKRVGRWGLGSSLAAVMAFIIVRRLRKRHGRAGSARAARGPRGTPPIFRLYERALGRLAKRGWQRLPAETPREFANRLAAAQIAGAPAMARLTEHYGAARYGERDIPDSVVAGLEPSLEELATAERPAAPPPAGSAPP
jgi:transglutaminase-like putative cysteine protease